MSCACMSCACVLSYLSTATCATLRFRAVACLGHDRRGSLQWLPARVMSDLPRWHTQGNAAAAKTPATPTARHGPYLLVRLRVRPERHRAQSCAIALRSPAPERSSDLKHKVSAPRTEDGTALNENVLTRSWHHRRSAPRCQRLVWLGWRLPVPMHSEL